MNTRMLATLPLGRDSCISGFCANFVYPRSVQSPSSFPIEPAFGQHEWHGQATAADARS